MQTIFMQCSQSEANGCDYFTTFPEVLLAHCSCPSSCPLSSNSASLVPFPIFIRKKQEEVKEKEEETEQQEKIGRLESEEDEVDISKEEKQTEVMEEYKNSGRLGQY